MKRDVEPRQLELFEREIAEDAIDVKAGMFMIAAIVILSTIVAAVCVVIVVVNLIERFVF